MTKEEYADLLQSDYWKGYSYSLIKERNFTCEDCGRSFPNMRNMLQVHHLVYRDANPWSYKPNEVVVLCKECHQRRHGIITSPTNVIIQPKPIIIPSKETFNTNQGFQTNNQQAPSYQAPLRHTSSTQKRATNTHSKTSGGRFLLFAGFVALIVAFLLEYHKEKVNTSLESKTSKTTIHSASNQKTTIGKQATTPTPKAHNAKANNQNQASTNVVIRKQEPNILQNTHELIDFKSPNQQKEYNEVAKEIKPNTTKVNDNNQEKSNKSSLELLEERNHAHVVERAKRAGVSTEGSTSDILDRINHAHVVESAKRAGVSTEGSTSDILDRINHAHVVESAKRAGVSTEGSTSDILDRINHAHVVESAKRAGVSTEGSTSDILDRINHAHVVESAKRAGVSTEGSTSDILDRINHAHVVESAKRAGVSTEGSTSDILERISQKHLEGLKGYQ